MAGRLMNRLKGENGSVQVMEASIVFPVMFIILYFLIFMGNAYYLKAQIEKIVVQEAIAGANYCADPILQTLRETNSLPSVKDIDTQPYRYILGGMKGIENKISQEVGDALKTKLTSLFTGMMPTSIHSSAEFHNMVICSTFSVQVSYRISFPIRMFGESTPPILYITSRSEMAVNDVAEFIRNTDMVIDMFEGSKMFDTIRGVFEKINGFISSFAKK